MKLNEKLDSSELSRVRYEISNEFPYQKEYHQINDYVYYSSQHSAESDGRPIE